MKAKINLQFKNLPGESIDRTETVEVASPTELVNKAYRLRDSEKAENVNFYFVDENETEEIL